MHKKLPSSSGQPHVHRDDANFDQFSFQGKDSGDGNDEEVECPDHKSKCPPHTTCCPLDSTNNGNGTALTTTYGCCPAEEAVCCEDKIHCCPVGLVCVIIFRNNYNIIAWNHLRLGSVAMHPSVGTRLSLNYRVAHEFSVLLWRLARLNKAR